MLGSPRLAGNESQSLALDTSRLLFPGLRSAAQRRGARVALRLALHLHGQHP